MSADDLVRKRGRRDLAQELAGILWPERFPPGDANHDPDHVFWTSGQHESEDAFQWSADTAEWIGVVVDRELERGGGHLPTLKQAHDDARAAAGADLLTITMQDLRAVMRVLCLDDDERASDEDLAALERVRVATEQPTSSVGYREPARTDRDRRIDEVAREVDALRFWHEERLEDLARRVGVLERDLSGQGDAIELQSQSLANEDAKVRAVSARVLVLEGQERELRRRVERLDGR